ncbi:YegP family protein [Pseudarthrobacter oxydans]|uniref:YegP family protein n=1 Tax=Pseudarthrobacter oxydans TaxID=1671 RepID=UPI0038105F14
MFELFNDEDSNFRFRITGPDGAVMATSCAFPDKASAVAGIRDVREYAGMGHITDMCLPPMARAVAEPVAAVAGDAASGPDCFSQRPGVSVRPKRTSRTTSAA